MTVKINKWTKADINRLIQAIDSWAVSFRDWYHGKDFVTDATVFLALEDNRRKIIVHGVRSLGYLASDRAIDYRATADHAHRHPLVWGDSTQEIIDRFEGYAREAESDAKKAEALARRVEAESLPEAVQNYVIFSRFR